MGEPESVWAERIEELSPYQVNAELMRKTGKATTIFMHCLPSYHVLKTKIGKEMGEKFGRTEMEVTDEVFESKNSVVFREAENQDAHNKSRYGGNTYGSMSMKKRYLILQDGSVFEGEASART